MLGFKVFIVTRLFSSLITKEKMDRSLNENSDQSSIDDIEESALHESLTDDKDSANDSACSTEETLKNESEPGKDYQAFDSNDEASSADLSKGELDLIDKKVREVCKDTENYQRLTMEAKRMKYSEDNKPSSAESSTVANAGLVSFPNENIIDVPTKQASESSISTSTAISRAQTKSSEPLAIPSTSKGPSGLAPSSKSSPKRPTNFGRNVKQAIHVFHPINPKSILQKVPIPIHSGRWVYLRDSPESSDYGGSPDSLDDPFLMEALCVKTPECENEDMFTPRNEEMPPCPPPIQNPVLDFDTPVGELAISEGGLLSDPGHYKRTFGDVPSSHTKQNIEDYSHEPGSIPGIAEDKPLRGEGLPCTNDYPERAVESLLSDLASMNSADSFKQLNSESSCSSRSKGDASNKSSSNIQDIGDKELESVTMQKTSENLDPRLNDSQINVEDYPSESALTEENMSSELASELSNIESNTVIEDRLTESSLALKIHFAELSSEEMLKDTP
ncbi:hypothetical protein JTE90_017781 [Oedothorax gibbosus]|uniref:Uncharacterized protein n=1 Tax=Oedothorax gibbosus TaxID=931172 RepID=A0AAV6UMT8_9ARAC|nr:hypothetical protein JTE90_017781 [Oedothorax gibbosus]